MPNVNNRSNKFQATREIYSTLEFVEEDNGRIADIALEAIQSSTMSKKRKKVLSTEVNFKRRRVADKITSMQRSMGPVAGTGDLENTTRRIRNEFEQNEDGSYDLSELMKSPPPSDHALVPAAVTPFSPVAEPTVGAQRKRNNSVMNTPELLPPSGGKEQYDPPSAIDAIKMHPKHLRARIVGSMVRNGKVPVQDRQMRVLLKADDAGIETKSKWNQRGKPKISSVKTLFQKLLSKVSSSAEMAKHDIVDESMTEIAADEHKRKGRPEGTLRKISNRTTRRYRNIVKHLTTGAFGFMYKNETRKAAERAPRNVASFLHTIAATHYIIAEDGVGDRSIKNATRGAQFLYDLVSEHHGGAALKPIKPENLYSTDDSAIFGSKNLGHGQVQWFYRFDTDRSIKKSTSLYTTCKDKLSGGFISGVTVRYTTTISGGGISAPIFLQVLHLNE